MFHIEPVGINSQSECVNILPRKGPEEDLNLCRYCAPSDLDKVETRMAYVRTLNGQVVCDYCKKGVDIHAHVIKDYRETATDRRLHNS